jgi:hypothetical protein
MITYKQFVEQIVESQTEKTVSRPSVSDMYGGGVYVGDYKGYRIVAATGHNGEGSKSGVNWKSAKRFCDDLTVGKYSDWDVPSKFEMDLISQDIKSGSGRMHRLGGSEYWTSTEVPGETTQAYSRDFYNGSGSRGTLNKSEKSYTLSVIAIRREKI